MKLLDSDIKTREILVWKGIHLLNYQFSACSMKTRIYLNLKNLPFKSHQINLSAGENFSPWFQGINPRSLVPVLIHDGDVHIESNDILQYLEGCFKNNPLIPADKQTQVSELLSFEDDLHIDIRNITFRFMVPKLLNKGKKAKPKSNDKATLHGEVDPLDDANRKFWQEYEEFGIKDEDVKESLIKMNNARFLQFCKINSPNFLPNFRNFSSKTVFSLPFSPKYLQSCEIIPRYVHQNLRTIKKH